MLNAWKRDEILRNKTKLQKNIYVKREFSKEVLERRKELIPQLKKNEKRDYTSLFDDIHKMRQTNC